MSQSNPTTFGTESWKRMSAILLVAVMVIMVAMPMISAEEGIVEPDIILKSGDGYTSQPDTTDLFIAPTPMAGVINVGIAQGGWFTNDLHDYLDAKPDITSTLIPDVNAGTIAPFDVIILYGNQWSYNPTAINDFVTAGGNVIATPWILGNGHYFDALPVTDTGGSDLYDTPLDITVTDPGDPILNGVTFNNGDSVGYERNRPALKPGATSPVNWNDAENVPAVAYWNYGAGMCTYLNFHYITSDCDLAIWYGWGQNLIYNAVTKSARTLNIYWYDDYEEENYAGSIREYLEGNGHTVTYQEDDVGIWPDAAALIPNYDVIVAEHTCGGETIINLDKWFEAGKGYVALFGGEMYNDPPEDNYIMNQLGVGLDGGYNDGVWSSGDLFWTDPGHSIATYPNSGWDITNIPDGQYQYLVDITGGDNVLECPAGPVLQTQVGVEGVGKIAVMGSNYHNADRTDPETRKLVENMIFWAAPPQDPNNFEVNPETQTGVGWIGDYVDHTITVQNDGAVADVYKVYSSRGMFVWPTEVWDVDNNEEISHSEVVPPGGTWQFNARVRVPRVSMGDFDIGTIAIESLEIPGNPTNTVNVITRTSLPYPFYDDFESGTFGVGPVTDGDWITTNSNNCGINDDVSVSPVNSMWLGNGPVTVTSAPIYTQGQNNAMFSCAVKAGSPAFSEGLSDGQNLIIEYFNSRNRWVEWDTLPGVPGEIYRPTHALPGDAYHPAFRVRFTANDGDGIWHIDDVYIGPINSDMDLGGGGMKTGYPGDIVQHYLNVDNDGDHNDIYEITLEDNTWPTTVWTPSLIEDFDDGDMGGWTKGGPAIGNWHAGGGTARETTNAGAEWRSPGRGTYLTYDGGYGFTDFIYDVDMYATDNDVIGTMFRYTDNNNFYRFQMNQQTDLDLDFPGDQRRGLMSFHDGTWEYLAWDSWTYTQSTWYNVEIKAIGDRIQVYFDGNLLWDVTDDSNSQGTVALYCNHEDNAYFDNVMVYEPENTLNLIPGENQPFIVTVEVQDEEGWMVDNVYLEITSTLDPTESENRDLWTSLPPVLNVEQHVWYYDIQPAIDDANPGEHINVYSENFNENIIIDKPLTVTGFEGASIHGDNTGRVVQILSDNVEFGGFNIEGSGVGPGFAHAGIFLEYAQNCRIHDNYIEDCYAGIYSRFSGDNIIEDNWIDDNFADMMVIGNGYETVFQDDFETDSGRWAYGGDAGRTNGYAQLTENVDWQTGWMWYDTKIKSSFVADFDFQIGGGNGADGMTFAFYKDTAPPYDPSAAGGGFLGFDGSDGYAIEFDHYFNGGIDPTGNDHVALIQNDVSNHLSWGTANYIDDNTWHHARVFVDENSVYVFVNDMTSPLFSWFGALDTTYGGFGFTGTTGGDNHNHRVDNVQIRYGDKLGSTVQNNIFLDAFAGNILKETDGNTILENVYAENIFGIRARGSTNNLIYHNDFFDNIIQANDELYNMWENGYPSGGNFWSNYFGVDNFKGPAQNIPGSDDIGDTMYDVLPGGPPNADWYPLMEPYFFNWFIMPVEIDDPIASLNGMNGTWTLDDYVLMPDFMKITESEIKEIIAYSENPGDFEVAWDEPEEIIEAVSETPEVTVSVPVENTPDDIVTPAIIQEPEPAEEIIEEAVEPVVEEVPVVQKVEPATEEVQDSSPMVQDEAQTFNTPWFIMIAISIAAISLGLFWRKR